MNNKVLCKLPASAHSECTVVRVKETNVVVKRFKQMYHYKLEMHAWQRINELPLHANIVRCLCIDNAAMTVVLEYGGDDLMSIMMNARRRHVFCVTDTLMLFKQLIESIAHMHSHHLAHRDVKPENIVISGAPQGLVLKMIDFSWCCTVEPGQQQRPRGGTAQYAAVEYFSTEPCSPFPSDIWSAALVGTILLFGIQMVQNMTETLKFHKLCTESAVNHSLLSYDDCVSSIFVNQSRDDEGVAIQTPRIWQFSHRDGLRAIYGILYVMLGFNPDLRPTASDILSQLAAKDSVPSLNQNAGSAPVCLS